MFNEEKKNLTEKISRKEQENKAYLSKIEDKQRQIADFEIELTNFLNYKEKEINEINNNNFKEKEALEEKCNKKVFELNMKIDEYIEKMKLIEDKLNFYEKENISTAQSQNDMTGGGKTNFSNESAKNLCREIMVRIKNDLTDYEFLIDKRIISNILLKYFDKNADHKLKSALLDTLANIMGYGNDEKKRLGLTVSNNSLSGRKQEANVNSEGDNLKDLINELWKYMEQI